MCDDDHEHFQPGPSAAFEGGISRDGKKGCSKCPFKTKSLRVLLQHKRQCIGDSSAVDNPTSHSSVPKKPHLKVKDVSKDLAGVSNLSEADLGPLTADDVQICDDCQEQVWIPMNKHKKLCFKCKYCGLWKRDEAQHLRYCNAKNFDEKQNQKANTKGFRPCPFCNGLYMSQIARHLRLMHGFSEDWLALFNKSQHRWLNEIDKWKDFTLTKEHKQAILNALKRRHSSHTESDTTAKGKGGKGKGKAKGKRIVAEDSEVNYFKYIMLVAVLHERLQSPLFNNYKPTLYVNLQ